MLSGINLFRLADDRMRYLAERQTVLARNIANADTPGYRAQDLAPFTPTVPLAGSTAPMAASAGAPLALACTEPGHIATAGAAAGAGSSPVQVVDSKPDYGENASGNDVSIEEQMLKTADVANAFSLASAAYANSVTIMKMAIDSNH